MIRTRAKTLALVGALVVLPMLMADSCNESYDTVDVHDIFMDVGGTGRVIDGRAVHSGRDASVPTLEQGEFLVAAGVPGTLVLRFGSRTTYRTCDLYLQGKHTLPVLSGIHGDYELRLPSGPLMPNRTVDSSVTCYPDAAFGFPSTTTFTVSTLVTGQLVPSVDQLDFGTVPVGTASAPKTVTYRNVGKAPVQVDAEQYGAWIYGGFVLDRDACSGRTIPVGGTCTITLHAQPGPGSALVMDLELDSDARAPTRRVHLTASTGSGPSFGVSAVTVDFGGVDVGSIADRSVTVTNVGGGQFTIDSVVVEKSTQFTTISDPCSGRTLFGGGSCVVMLRFAPTVGGYATATLTFRDSAPGGQHSVTLTGIGNAPAPTTGGPIEPP